MLNLPGDVSNLPYKSCHKSNENKQMSSERSFMQIFV